jgi:hypothetical protein
MELFELIIDENEVLSGVNALSLVETPANASDWVALSDQAPVLLAEVNKDKRILMGAALIPDRPIYRNQDGKEFYIYFSAETVAKSAEMFFKNSNHTNATLEHSVRLEGMTVFESWIVEDPEMDKSVKYGLNVPKGTWMVSMKVDDENIWNDYIKNNKVFGFSIEGQYSNILRKEAADMSLSDQEISKALESVKRILSEHYSR